MQELFKEETRKRIDEAFPPLPAQKSIEISAKLVPCSGCGSVGAHFCKGKRETKTVVFTNKKDTSGDLIAEKAEVRRVSKVAKAKLDAETERKRNARKAYKLRQKIANVTADEARWLDAYEDAIEAKKKVSK